MGDRATDVEEQQRAPDDGAAGEHGQCGGVEEAARHVQGGECPHEETSTCFGLVFSTYRCYTQRLLVGFWDTNT